MKYFLLPYKHKMADERNFDSAEGRSTDIAESRSTNSSGESEEESYISYDRVLKVESEAELQEKKSQVSTGDSNEEELTSVEREPDTETTVADLRHSQFYTIDVRELRNDEDSVHVSNSPESTTEPTRELLSTKSDDDQLRLTVAAAQRELQERINQLEKELQELQAKNQILEVELGRKAFLEDKQNRSRKVVQISRAAGGASHVEGNFPGSSRAGPLELQETSFLLQRRLLEISNSLSEAELRQMKFLARPKVNAFRLKNIREGFELFEELETNGELSCAYVGELLKGIQRFDLLQKLEQPSLGNLENGSCRSTDQRMLDNIPCNQAADEGPSSSPALAIISSGDKALDVLPERHDDAADETSDGMHVQGDEGNDRVSGINEADSGCNMASGNSENSRGDVVAVSANVHCDDSSVQQSESSDEEPTRFSETSGSLSSETSSVFDGSSANAAMMTQPFPDFSDGEKSPEVSSGVVFVPAYRLDVRSDSTAGQSVSDIRSWERFGARPKDRLPMQRVPLELSEPNVAGVNVTFLARHSQDRGLPESLHHNSLLSAASDVEPMMNFTESNRADLNTIDWQRATRSDEISLSLRFPLPSHLSVGGNERGDGVGRFGFNELLDGNTGLVPPSTLNSGYQLSASTGGLHLVDAVNSGLPSPYPLARSNGTNNGFESEVGSSEASQRAEGNASSNLMCTTGIHLAAERLHLAHGVQNLCTLVEQLMEELEEQRERERERREIGAREREEPRRQRARPAQAVCRPFEVPLPCTIQSLDSNHNCEPEFWQDVARARAQIEERDGEAASASIRDGARRWCTCASRISSEDPICRRCFQQRYLGPSSNPEEHSCTCCACLEINEESRSSGSRMPERCRPGSGHDECCICLEDTFGGCQILPCSHKVHVECFIAMIRGGELNCPNCGHPILRRG